MSKRLLMFWTTALGMLVSTAGAEQYWITYEGNDFPENEGWNRSWGNDEGQYHGDGATRTLENGVLTMDSLYDLRVYDYAYITRPGALDPGPGDTFVIEWRLMVTAVAGDYYDTTFNVSSDGAMQLGFGFFPDHVESTWEENVTIAIASGEFHEYRVQSHDMHAYDLYIDGAWAYQGIFCQRLKTSELAWGNGVSGASSRAHWDYLRFGVVPEPYSLVMAVALCACSRGRRNHVYKR